MTIAIDVYCKQKPEWKDLADPLGWEESEFLPEYTCFKWIPKGCGSHIYLYFNPDPIIYSGGYDKETIDDMIATAKEKGFTVPDGLIQKFIRDNNSETTIVTGTAPDQDSGPNNPLIMSVPAEGEGYTVRADRELYIFLCENPALIETFPLLKTEFTLARFSQGTPLHEIGLEAKQHAPKEVIANMVGVASYFAKSFDGVMYEDQTNEFGTPNPDRLRSIGMESFLAFTEDAKKKGYKTIPIGF